MFSKPPEYWAVLAGMVLYMAIKNAADNPLKFRILKTLASALLTLGFSEDLAPWVRDSETLAAIAIMAGGLILLDTLTSIMSDRDFIKDIIKSRIGR